MAAPSFLPINWTWEGWERRGSTSPPPIKFLAWAIRTMLAHLPNNVGSFAERVTTGSGRRSLGWPYWVHGALGTLTRGHQASTGSRSGAGTQGANTGLVQSQVLAALGWYIKHWSECAGFRGQSEWVTELEAAESSSAPSLLMPLYYSMFHNTTSTEQKWGWGQ